LPMWFPGLAIEVELYIMTPSIASTHICEKLTFPRCTGRAKD